MSKVILVTGATGKQGGAVLESLLASSTDVTIVAVTRDPSSGSAKALAQKSSQVKVVKGDLDHPAAIFEAAKEVIPQPISAVFSVQTPNPRDGQNPETELTQGKALIDAAIANSVEHFVQASVDRHGEKSPKNPTEVPHFISKHNIEQYLLSRSASNNMTWTIIQPVAFLENFSPPFGPAAFATMWKITLGYDKPLQLVSVVDIGHVSAQALLQPDKYAGRMIPLAGDEITLKDVQKIYKENTQSDLPMVPDEVASGILENYDMKKMFEFFVAEGYGADIPALKREFPNLLNFAAWLQK